MFQINQIIFSLEVILILIFLSKSKMDTNNYLCNFIEAFSLTNIVNSKTCFTTLKGTLLDLMLTSKPKPFCKTCTIEQDSVIATK